VLASPVRDRSRILLIFFSGTIHFGMNSQRIRQIKEESQDFTQKRQNLLGQTPLLESNPPAKPRWISCHAFSHGGIDA